MELRQIEYFLAVTEERHFTRAAELLHISQSGLSAGIRSLERELGAPLFERTTRRVELTPAGLALLPHARSVAAAVMAGRDAVVATIGELAGELRVGAEQCLAAVDVGGVLERFSRRYPSVRVQFEQAGTAVLLDGVRRGTLDVAFVAGGPEVGAGEPVRPGAPAPTVLATEGRVLLCPPHHPLAGRARVACADLEREPFIDFDPAWGARRLNDATFAARGLTRHVAFTVNDVHTLVDLVGRGMGVALVPRPIACKPQAAGLWRAALAEPVPDWHVAVATGPATPLTTRLLELLEVARVAA